jgi:hypothetical protein
METLRPLIPFLIPVFLLQIGLLIFALLDLSRRGRTNGPKPMWVAIIVLVQIIGPILYFVLGRTDE